MSQGAALASSPNFQVLRECKNWDFLAVPVSMCGQSTDSTFVARVEGLSFGGLPSDASSCPGTGAQAVLWNAQVCICLQRLIIQLVKMCGELQLGTSFLRPGEKLRFAKYGSNNFIPPPPLFLFFFSFKSVRNMKFCGFALVFLWLEKLQNTVD